MILLLQALFVLFVSLPGWAEEGILVHATITTVPGARMDPRFGRPAEPKPHPAPAVEVRALAGLHVRAIGKTNAKGELKLILAPGRYTVQGLGEEVPVTVKAGEFRKVELHSSNYLP